MNSTTAKKRCLALIAEHDADLNVRQDGQSKVDVNVWSPAGFVWQATTCHSLSAYAVNDRLGAWTGLLADLQLGLDPCTDDDCDTCQPAAADLLT